MSDFAQKLQIQLLCGLPGLDAQLLMAPPIRKRTDTYDASVKLGGVLVLLYHQQDVLHVLLMKRTQDGGIHSGQISFPGGRFEHSDGSITYTAMRECAEEMGIASTDYKVLGTLTPLFIPPSNFLVTPTLAYTAAPPKIQASTAEVLQVLPLPISKLFNSASKQVRTVYRSDDNKLQMEAPVYVPQDDIIIWGATAMMLSELEVLLASANLA